MSNFSFLKTSFPDLEKLGQLAERNVHSDPQTTLSKLRLLCEQVVLIICQIESIAADQSKQVDRLNTLFNEGVLPDRIATHFHSIRIAGNKAIHQNYDSVEEAINRLRQARNVCIWFVRTYGDIADSDLAIEEFVFPVEETIPKATLEALENEIQQLNEDKKALLQQLIQKRAAESKADKNSRIRSAKKYADELDISEEEARILIDEKLIQVGWDIIPYAADLDLSLLNHHAVEEYPTDSGPVDYIFVVEGQILGLLEAKRPSTNVENVLDQQSKRYSKTIQSDLGNWNGYKVPYLFASNSEQIYYLDVRSSTNLPRELFSYHSPSALKERYERDEFYADEWLTNTPIQHSWIRPYQSAAIKAVEEAIIGGRSRMMLAMATGTGKTFTASNLIYRMLKSKKVNRILFLVDRRSLAAQTVREFASFDTPDNNKLHKEYEIYSQKFRKSDFEDEPYSPEVLPNEYLTNPDGSKTFIYVSTIQRMAYNLYGKKGHFGNENGDEEEEDVETIVDIPIHAFDLIIADECHRGYTSRETNLWRNVLNHFDALKIGMTATPAAHTIAFFNDPIFEYSFDQAVLENFLVDYDPIPIYSKVKINGTFLKEGELIGDIDTDTGREELHKLEAERDFNASDIEVSITAPDTNKKILLELKKHCDAFEKKYERFPKTLIFAVNDVPHVSHADEIVKQATEIFGKGHDFVKKITGNKNVDRPLQLIKEFRNRPEPGIVVTVDMLSTGVDIPKLEFIVFLRPVKSRILWEQMLGRGTRKMDAIGKDRFYVFDCFGGGLFEYFKNASAMSGKVLPNVVPLKEIIERIYNKQDLDYNVKRLIKRLRRVQKRMTGAAAEDFERFIPDGDIGKFADALPKRIDNDFIATLKILRNEDFQYLLLNYKRPKKSFLKAYEVVDEVHSEQLFKKVGERDHMKPEDYLAQFKQYVQDNQEQIEALKIILERPSGWNTNVMEELLKKLKEGGFVPAALRDVHKIVHDKEMVDLISMIKHAINEEEVLLSREERVDRGMNRVFVGMELTEDQKKWVEYIRAHLKANLTIDKEDFSYAPVFESRGGWSKFKKLFGKDEGEKIISDLNRAIAA